LYHETPGAHHESTNLLKGGTKVNFRMIIREEYRNFGEKSRERSQKSEFGAEKGLIPESQDIERKHARGELVEP
jgi:hypothetical protein